VTRGRKAARPNKVGLQRRPVTPKGGSLDDRISKSTAQKFQWPRAFAARFSSRPDCHRPGMVCVFARAVSPPPDGGYPNGNTAEGTDALSKLTTGPDNTAIGFDALFSNTTGGGNTATGARALNSNTSGFINTATGFFALGNNTSGVENTATGAQALYFNTTGGGNTANGSFAP
jgi:hypothetical protein